MLEYTIMRLRRPRYLKMSKQVIWLLIAVVVLLGLAAAYLYWPEKPVMPKEQELSKEQTGITNLQQALEKTQNVSAPDVPSANPLQKVAPIKNPIEVTNPFGDGYQNPF